MITPHKRSLHTLRLDPEQLQEPPLLHTRKFGRRKALALQFFQMCPQESSGAISVACRQKAEKGSFYRQGDRQCRFRLATAQCPAHMPMASTGAALVIPTPLARKRLVPERTVRTAPASPASRTASELLQRHPPNPVSLTDRCRQKPWRAVDTVNAGLKHIYATT